MVKFLALLLSSGAYAKRRIATKTKWVVVRRLRRRAKRKKAALQDMVMELKELHEWALPHYKHLVLMVSIMLIVLLGFYFLLDGFASVTHSVTIRERMLFMVACTSATVILVEMLGNTGWLSAANWRTLFKQMAEAFKTKNEPEFTSIDDMWAKSRL